LRKIDIVFAWVMILLGVLHCGAAWISIRGFPVGAIWGFAGGAALIEGGLLNVVRLHGGKGISVPASITGNVLLAILVASVGWSQFSHLVHRPSFFVTAAVVVAELLFSFRGN
jgi:hypothetical protein